MSNYFLTHGGSVALPLFFIIVMLVLFFMLLYCWGKLYTLRKEHKDLKEKYEALLNKHHTAERDLFIALQH